MKLHIEHAGNGQTIIADETKPVAYLSPALSEGQEEILAALFAASPAFASMIDALEKANQNIYGALILCNESRDRLTCFHRSEESWIEEARFAMEKTDEKSSNKK